MTGEERPEASEPTVLHGASVPLAHRGAPLPCVASRASSELRQRDLRPPPGSSTWNRRSSSCVAHRALGGAEHGAALGGDLQPQRAPVVVGDGPGHEAALDERVDRRRDRRLGERQAPGDLAGPLGAVGDHGQQPVLGQGQLGARPFEQAGQAGEGEHGGIHDRKYTEQFVTPTYVRKLSGEGPGQVAFSRQAGIHCGVTDP